MLTSNEVRVYLTEAIDRLFYDKGVRLPGEPKNVLAAEVLAVVETLRTPCPKCHGAQWTCDLGEGCNQNRRISPCPHNSRRCETCGGTGQSALLAFDEMRGLEQVGVVWVSPQTQHHWVAENPPDIKAARKAGIEMEPVYRFPAVQKPTP